MQLGRGSGVIDASLSAMVHQLLWRLSVFFDRHLSMVLKGPVASTLTAQYEKVGEALGHASTLGLRLAQYITTRHSMCKSTMYGIANDKGVVSRLPLRTSYIVLPSNLATLCPPVVGSV